MELKGKAKEQFEKWYLEKYFKNLFPLSMQEKFAILDSFDEIYKAMKWGVYQDFADSVWVMLPSITKGWDCFFTSDRMVSKQHKSRPEARTAAINKLNEILNK